MPSALSLSYLLSAGPSTPRSPRRNRQQTGIALFPSPDPLPPLPVPSECSRQSAGMGSDEESERARITPALSAALEQQWYQMQMEAQRLALAVEMKQRAQSASLNWLVARSRRERLVAVSDQDLLERCRRVAAALRITPALEAQICMQANQWPGRLARMQGTQAAVEAYDAFLRSLCEPASVQSKEASTQGANCTSA